MLCCNSKHALIQQHFEFLFTTRLFVSVAISRVAEFHRRDVDVENTSRSSSKSFSAITEKNIATTVLVLERIPLL